MDDVCLGRLHWEEEEGEGAALKSSEQDLEFKLCTSISEHLDH